MASLNPVEVVGKATGLSSFLPVAGAVGGDILGSAVSGIFNAREARKSREFQRDMSNTAYQRAAKDLEAAGLNRILALGSPASSPSGAAAAIQAPSLGKTGIMAASAKQQIAQSKALELSALSDADLKQAQTDLATQQTRLTSAEADKQEVFKAFYKVANPLLKDLMDTAEPLTSGASDFIKSLPDRINLLIRLLKPTFTPTEK